MMSRLTKDTSLPGPSASPSHEGLESDGSSASNRTLKVTLLSSEWWSSKGGLSTINRELAIQLAKHPNVEVCMYLPQCSEEDKKTAACHKVHLIEAEEMPGYDPVDWLASTPKDHVMDCVIGHGVHLGRQVLHIKRVHGNCKWVQLVHTDPEELGMFKSYPYPVSKSEKKHQAEVKLCQLADQVVAVGSKLAEAFAAYLRPSGKDQDVFNLTPSIFTEFMDVTQAAEERKTFRVLMFGRGDSEDFRLKGYDIAAKAIAELKDMPQDYKLVFVDEAVGEEEKVTELLLKEGIAPSQLTIRHFDESREYLAELFCEVDLAIMPSRTEGFGLAALEAFSAGLPVLVSGNSGLGDALKKVLHGSNCVVNSDDPKRWAEAIQGVCSKDRGVRLGETKDLCGKYAEKYSWEEQCGRLLQKMMDITFRTSTSSVKGYYVQVESIAAPDKGLSGLQSSAGKENKEPTPTDEDGPSTEQSPIGGRDQETSGSTFDLKDLLIKLLISAPDLDDERRAALYDLLASIGKTYVQFHNLTPELRRVEAFYEHLKDMYNSTLVTVNKSSLEIVVRCPTLESLEHLWGDCRSGHLNKIAERLLVTDEIKRKLNLETVRLTTTIEKENYLKCKKALMEMSGAAGSTHLPSEETKPDEGEDPRGTGTSSDVVLEALKVTFLASEWSSSAGSLPRLNRELAIHLSQHPKVDVSFLVPDGHCTDEEKKEAQSFGITVVDAKKCPGWMPLEWLSAPPRGHKMDVVIGHGVKLGRQVSFIKDSDRYQSCKWVQVVHTDSEDLSKYKDYPDPISKGQEKHEVEVAVCKLADLVVPVGPRLKESYSAYLQGSKRDIFPIIPGLFDREFGDLEQSPNENAEFKVLLCGRNDEEEFELKGYDIAAEAFTDHRLQGKCYHLIFVGAPEGKQEEVKQRLLQCGIAEEQLTVRKFVQSREKMKDLLCEVNLAIMPSKSEGFSMVALEALSAGLPILVNGKSGFARALENIPLGKSCILESDEPAKWAEAIEGVCVRHRVRLKEIKVLRASYYKQYSWKEQVENFVENLWTMVHGSSTGRVKTPTADPPVQGQSAVAAPDRVLSGQQPSSDRERKGSGANVEREPSGEQSLQKERKRKTSGSTFDLGLQPPVEDEKTSETEEEDAFPQTASEGHTSPFSRKGPQTVTVQLKIAPEGLNDEQQEIFNDLMQQLVLAMEPNKLSAEEGVGVFISYLKESHNVLVKRFKSDGLEMTVECPTPGSLESLLNDNHSGHLREIAEACVVSDEIKKVLNVETVWLNIFIKEQSQLELIRMASGQTVKDQERSATWNNTGATCSTGSSPSQDTESTPGSRWTPPKHELHHRTNVRWTETKSQTQNDEKPDLSCRTRAERARASRSALHKAAINGQYKNMKMLLGRGEDVDKRDQFSLTPLHLACWYGQESITSLLLEHGANANAVDRFHRTPLQKAERHNHHSIVQLLLKNNARPTYQQPLSLRRLSRKAFLQVNRRLGFNLLQAAVYEGDYDIVFKASGLLPGDFVQEMNSKTAVNDDHFFSGMNAVDILSCLDEERQSHAQIDKLYQDSVEKYKTLTELHWCICSDDTERAVELVLNDGVDPNIPALSNRTPLLWASPSSSSMFVKTLIDLGADVNVQRTGDKVTPLGLASGWNNYMSILLLLEHGADVNVENIYGARPLSAAVHNGHENLVKLLLKNNADVNFQDSKGDSVLHFSVCKGSFEVSKLLIGAGCNINVRNKSDKTPLYLAVEKNDEQLATLLLAHGADVHIQYSQDPTKRVYLVRGKDRGKPAWHYVLVEKFLLGLFLKRTQGGRLDVADFGKVLKSGWGVDPPPGTIEKILEDGGDLFKETPGETLLHVASRNNSTSIMQLLIDLLSRDLNSHDIEGFTPLHIAAIHGNMQAVRKLVDLGADVNQALPVAVVARINEEFEIEEYLKSKMAFKDGSGERKGELDVFTHKHCNRRPQPQINSSEVTPYREHYTDRGSRFA